MRGLSLRLHSPGMENNEVIENDNEVYQVWQLLNEKKYIEIDFYMEILLLNVMYMGQKRLFNDDIQTIATEALQPSQPPSGKNSNRNIQSVPRKRRRGKRLTLSPGSNYLSPSTPALESVILSPSAPENKGKQVITAPKVLTTHDPEPPRIATVNVLTTKQVLEKIKTPTESNLQQDQLTIDFDKDFNDNQLTIEFDKDFNDIHPYYNKTSLPIVEAYCCTYHCASVHNK